MLSKKLLFFWSKLRLINGSSGPIRSAASKLPCFRINPRKARIIARISSSVITSSSIVTMSGGNLHPHGRKRMRMLGQRTVGAANDFLEIARNKVHV
jgi:hypothetical protein